MDYSILRCGAVADGVTNCAAAIQQAVDAAAALRQKLANRRLPWLQWSLSRRSFSKALSAWFSVVPQRAQGAQPAAWLKHKHPSKHNRLECHSPHNPAMHPTVAAIARRSDQPAKAPVRYARRENQPVRTAAGILLVPPGAYAGKRP